MMVDDQMLKGRDGKGKGEVMRRGKKRGSHVTR